MKFLDKLNSRINSVEYRQLLNLESFTDFWSNDYLGLSASTLISKLNHGSTGSRLISGHSNIHNEVEKLAADFFNTEKSLLFNSGVDANVGVLSSLPQKGETIIYDELCHASIRDGIRLSMAKNFSFKHNDVEHLEKKLKNTQNTVYVVVESLYSMDGDLAPLKDLVEICKKYHAKLIVDEAHSAGVYGNGKGYVSELHLDEDVFIKSVTVGKAFGLHGALVCCDHNVREFLINFCRTFIYTTAVSPAHCDYIKQRINEVDKGDDLRRNLFHNINYFNDLCGLSNPSPIFSFGFENLENCHQKAQELKQNGIATKEILSPTVPKGKERIRICIHAFNTEKELDILASLLWK